MEERSKSELLALTNDVKLKAIIRGLWREFFGLYGERFNPDPELEDKWLASNIVAKFGQFLGQDHIIEGNQSLAIGIGAITKAFREIILGSYGLDNEAISAEEWDSLDLLLSIANGKDKDNRSNALELYKSGLVKLLNGLEIGKYDHKTLSGDLVAPKDWTLSKEDEGICFWKDNKWIPLFLPKATEQEVIEANEETIINKYLAPDHLHLLEVECMGGEGDQSGSHVMRLNITDPAIPGVRIYADQQIIW